MIGYLGLNSYDLPKSPIRTAPSWQKPWRIAPAWSQSFGMKYWILKRGKRYAFAGPYDTIDQAMNHLRRFLK